MKDLLYLFEIHILVLLDIYLEMGFLAHIIVLVLIFGGTSMFIAALFIIIYGNKPNAHQWMDKEYVIYRYNRISFSLNKRRKPCLMQQHG